MEFPLPPREAASFVTENSRDVYVDPEGVRRMAELLLPAAAAWRVEQWKSLHELNPRGADEAALNWVFVVDTLNFSFWAEQEEHRCEVQYGGRAYTGYWALCAAVNRALDQGGCGRPFAPVARCGSGGVLCPRLKSTHRSRTSVSRGDCWTQSPPKTTERPKPMQKQTLYRYWLTRDSPSA